MAASYHDATLASFSLLLAESLLSCWSSWVGLMSYRARWQALGAAGLDLGDRDHWRPYVAHFMEQAMQCGLVGLLGHGWWWCSRSRW